MHHRGRGETDFDPEGSLIKMKRFVGALVFLVVLMSIGSGAPGAGAAGVHRVSVHRVGAHRSARAAAADGAAVGLARMVTHVWVGSNHPWVETGADAVLRAQVYPHPTGRGHLSGNVTWTITGNDGSTVPCAALLPLHANGRSTCRVGFAEFLRAKSPYTVTAAYSGDARFRPSTGTFNEHIYLAEARVLVTVSPRPVSGAATTVTVHVTAGVASPLLNGTVWIKATASHWTRGVNVACTGSPALQGHATPEPLVNGTASCVLPAGWLVVPPATAGDRHPRSAWVVTGSYTDHSFGYVTRAMTGSATG
jgi:hypothetical protein